MEHQTSEFKSTSGFKRILKASSYTVQGLVTAWKIEHAFRQELLVFVLGVIFAFVLPVSGFQRLVLIGVLLLVLIVELINSAFEAVVDRISLERHPLSKNAKDFGSAAVGLTVLLAAATWGTVLYNRFA
ncbi:diacylglycerol kinase [Massilia sp. Dwa41.01b]|uniref:diacylglycerol kinase n=1 Tax=unclassified Massilia TaxID=2609279 RepID=UPI001601195C|nr:MULTISPECIES: diacylglycerol kinase [unclassified Massilia]QNA90154.1 diacylglycerol kinase [Massilia sp. Dwa41.01b]QNB01043.1 diacylglycerol kinase [Massilia sp. Se16.2.3]